jgi:3-oxoadipate enol-lactonase
VTKEKKLQNSPIYYYITDNNATESILFIHAAFADHTSFDKQIEYFSQRYRVITLDLIGHGKSTQTKKGDDITKTADYISLIMEIEGIQQLHLVGVSIGAVLVQDFANKYPGKVASLCCIGAYDINHFDSSLQKENSGKQMGMMLKALISVKWFAESNKTISAATPEAQEAFYQMNIKFKKSSFRYLASLSKLVNKGETKKREYPLLIGYGDKDAPVEAKIAETWNKSEPESKLLVFKNAGHLVNMDVPEEFNVALDQFISATV